MQRVLSEEIVVTSFFCFPQLGLIYLHNPKVGCTTIQYNLVRAANVRDGVEKKIFPHRRHEGQYVNDIFNHPLFGSPKLRSMTCFSVVRNPFMRILSGYLGKIVQKTPVWRQFAREHGFDADAKENEMSFIDFLRIIDTDCDETMNAHFKPQYLNLMMPFSRPQFVGRLEDFAEVEKFLAERGVPEIARKGVATNTSGRLHEFYTPEAEAIVARKFVDDFRLFGYSPKLSEVRTLLEPQWQSNSSDLLMQWLADRKFPAEQLDPAPRTYVQFSAETDRNKRMQIVRGNFAQDDNTKRLKFYARMARRDGEVALAKAVDERFQTLKNAWRERVGGYTVPASAEKKAAARLERRSHRPERPSLKRKIRMKVEA